MGGGVPSHWRRWRQFGVRVLVFSRHSPLPKSHAGAVASSRNCLNFLPGEAKIDGNRLASSYSCAHPFPSNTGIGRNLDHFQTGHRHHSLNIQPSFPEIAFSFATKFASKNVARSLHGSPWRRWESRKTGSFVKYLGTVSDPRGSCCQSWLCLPGREACEHKYERHAFDAGNDVKFRSRAGQPRFHSTLPASMIHHRLGEGAPVGLQELASSLPATDVVDWQQQRVGRVKDNDIRQRPAKRSSSRSDAEPDDIFIPVKAFYISRIVDLKSLAREPFLEVTSSRNNLIIRCADRPPHSPVTADNPEMACLGFLKERYMVAFQYGSVVFFNFGDHEEVESLDVVRKYCSDEFRETRKDDYGVLVRPTLPEWSEGGHDRVMLRKLDIDNIRVISSVLGQSIALDHYARKVDEMVTTFSELNRGMEQTGTFTMTRKSLFQLVAAANTTLADVILRLGLLEKSDAAWKDANYAQIWEYLRDDFELDDRFENLDFKLNIIQHNVRFFLEILQNRKSDTLEWIIILLITGEICVSLYDILHSAGAI